MEEHSFGCRRDKERLGDREKERGRVRERDRERERERKKERGREGERERERQAALDILTVRPATPRREKGRKAVGDTVK